MAFERTRDQVINAVQVMKAKASANGTTQGELEALTAKIEELVLRYNLEQSEIEAKSGDPLDKYQSVAYSLAKHTRDVTWQRKLIRTLASFYFCDIVNYSGTPAVSIIGERDNIELLTFTYEILWREIKQMARADWRDHEAEARSHGIGKITRRNSFCIGAAAGIGARLRKERETFRDESEANTALIVVKDAEVLAARGKFFPTLKAGRQFAIDGDAWNAGYEAAQTMQIRKGLKTSK